MVTIIHKNSKETFNNFPSQYKHNSIFGYIGLGNDEEKININFFYVDEVNTITYDDITDEFITIN